MDGTKTTTNWIIAGLVAFQSLSPRLMAIPAFARKYKTACATCHNNWPELNDFGRAFKINGFKFPKDDETFVKEPPVLLGAEAQRENFPKVIYPGEIPGTIPIGFRFSGFELFARQLHLERRVIGVQGNRTTKIGHIVVTQRKVVTNLVDCAPK